MSDNRLKNFPFIKTVLMMTVILHHSIAFWKKDWFVFPPKISSVFLTDFGIFLSTFHVQTFTMISGYLFAYKMFSRKGIYSEFSSFFKSKAKRLLVPLLFISLFWSGPIGYLFFRWDRSTIFHNYILCEGPDQLWFILMLFDVFIIAWFLWDRVKDNCFIGWAFVLFLSVLGKIGISYLPNYYQIWIACQYLFFFYIGIRIRQKEEKGNKTIVSSVPSYIWALFHICLFVISRQNAFDEMILKLFGGMIYKLYEMGVGLLLPVIGSVSAFTVLNDLADKANWNNDSFIRLYSYSMPMYLFNQQICYFVIYWLGGMNPYLHALIIFIITFIGSYAISAFFMKFKLTRFLIGEK